MKLNLSYYKEDLKYDKKNNSENETFIKEYFNDQIKNKEKNIFKQNEDWGIIEGISNYRTNILKWYPFKEKANLLEIGAGFGELTGLFCEKCEKVTALEFSKIRGEIIQKRLSEKDNLEVIIGKIKDIDFKEKYDYITLIGSFNYAGILVEKEQDAYLELLKFVKTLLKEDGVILIATDNLFGVKYLSGEKSEHTSKIYDTLINQFENSRLFTKDELIEYIEKAGLKKNRFYYPLPNYKLPNVIFSENYLPNESLSKLDYYLYYNEGSIITKSEIDVIKQLNKHNLFENFCNSYLVEISNNISTINDVRFISFNNMRKEKYNLMLEINDRGDVIKEPTNEASIKHLKDCIDNIEELNQLGFNTIEIKDNKKIYSQYIKFNTLDKLLAKKITQGEIENVYKIIDEWFGILKEKFIKNETGNDLNYVKSAYIDLTFENVFYIENKYYVFDQEWKLDDIPLEFIFYRTIKNLYLYHKEIKKFMDINVLFTKYNLEKNIELFDSIEKEFQEMVLDREVCNHFINKLSKQYYNMDSIMEFKNEVLKTTEIIRQKDNLIEQCQNKIQENDEYYNDIIKLKNKNIESMEEIIKNLSKELSIYKSSRIIEFIRKHGVERKRGLCNKHYKK